MTVAPTDLAVLAAPSVRKRGVRDTIRRHPTIVIGATLLFAISLVQRVDETQHEQRLIPYLPYDQRTDYNYFYASATMALDGDASKLYPASGAKTVQSGDPAFGM